MSGETTPIYFSTYISKRVFNKVLKHCRSNWNAHKKIHVSFFVGTSGFCISYVFTTKLVQIKCIQNIQFSISMRRRGLFNKIFEMNKIEPMNCQVLFKQMHTMLCICTLENKCVACEHERLCAMKCRLGSGRISPQAGFEPRPGDPKLGPLGSQIWGLLHYHYSVI